MLHERDAPVTAETGLLLRQPSGGGSDTVSCGATPEAAAPEDQAASCAALPKAPPQRQSACLPAKAGGVPRVQTGDSDHFRHGHFRYTKLTLAVAGTSTADMKQEWNHRLLVLSKNELRVQQGWPW